MDNKTLNVGEHVIVTAHPILNNGNPGGYNPGSFEWTNVSGGVGITVTPASDGLSAEVAVAVDAPSGVSVFSIRFANSNGSIGDKQYSITVNAPPAETLAVTFGVPFVP